MSANDQVYQAPYTTLGVGLRTNSHCGMQALALVQQDLEGKKEELHQEVVRSTKYKNVHLKIQDAISEVSDCMTPAGSSRCSSSPSAFSFIRAGPIYERISFAYAFECLWVTCHLLARPGALLLHLAFSPIHAGPTYNHRSLA